MAGGAPAGSGNCPSSCSSCPWHGQPCHGRQPSCSCPGTLITPATDVKPGPSSAPDTYDIPRSTMRPGLFLLLGFLILRAELGTASEEEGGEEEGGKAGFCPTRAGLFPSYDCRAWCQRDAECPGEEKCCLRGCDYVCLPPSRDAV
ncbi:balbiani ring protein 3-like [Limosa lapponica baueri]|uniref:Balbiani ring protein 3-like n=1 Tax=Limosa lapponica baueri TaxID=1758121 RepID=A0A2I0T4T7_LIMLA|nr:balbiani ring protein 3-like [Limosa lapponica baueri]